MTRVKVVQTRTSNSISDLRWWQLEGTRMRDALWASFAVAREASKGRAQAYEHLRCLADRGVVIEMNDGDDVGGDTEECAENVIGQVIETASTKLLESRPDVQIQTDGAMDTAQMRAKELAGWVNSASQSIGLYDVVEEAWDEAMTVGTGAFRVFADEYDRPRAEVAYCEDLHVNPLEAKHNAVRTLYYERTMDRAALASMYPQHRNKLANSTASLTGRDAEDDRGDSARTWSDMVTVVEAWRFALVPPPADGELPKARAGRHIIATEGVVLIDEQYCSDKAPFRFMRWRKRRRSFWGVGIPESCEIMQSHMNLHASTTEETLQTLVPQVWVDDGTNTQRLDNIPGRVNASPGGKPPVMTAAHPGLLQAFTDREREYRERMFASQGVSQMEAQAQKPAGLNSGRAQLVHQDIKSKRLLMQGRQVEDAYTWAFDQLIRVADEIVERGGDGDPDALVYLAGEGEDITATAYADVRISEFMYQAKVFPVSKLPDSPAGRLEFVAELLQLGIVPPEDSLGLLSLPDLEGYRASRESMRTLAKAFCDHAATGEHDTEVAKMLTPLDDHSTVINYGHQLFARLRLKGRSPGELSELQAVIKRATDLQADAQKRIAEEQQPPPGPMPSAGPNLPPAPGGEQPPLM